MSMSDDALRVLALEINRVRDALRDPKASAATLAACMLGREWAPFTQAVEAALPIADALR